MTLHYAIQSDNGFSGPEMVPVCGYNFRRTKKLTDNHSLVTCPTCRKLSGFDDLREMYGNPFGTVCLPDPLKHIEPKDLAA